MSVSFFFFAFGAGTAYAAPALGSPPGSPQMSRWLTYAILAAFFLALILLLRFLYGPRGILRESHWESMEEARERKRAEHKQEDVSSGHEN